jgi:regulator of chromosome condensation
MAQLGLTSDANMRERKKPTLLKSLIDWDIVTFSCGALHNAAIAANGAVFTWGCNDDNALGRVPEPDAAEDEHEFTPAPVTGVLGGMV